MRERRALLIEIRLKDMQLFGWLSECVHLKNALVEAILDLSLSLSLSLSQTLSIDSSTMTIRSRRSLTALTSVAKSSSMTLVLRTSSQIITTTAGTHLYPKLRRIYLCFAEMPDACRRPPAPNNCIETTFQHDRHHLRGDLHVPSVSAGRSWTRGNQSLDHRWSSPGPGWTRRRGGPNHRRERCPHSYCTLPQLSRPSVR